MCLNPIRASFTYEVCNTTGAVLREAGRPKLDPEGELKLPCGKCDECISKRAIEWATRAKHEISCHKENCFITLTYNDDNRPDYIVKRDFQLFIKSLRKKYKLENKLRYMVSYEYGSKTNLPHMHAILFGFNFKNQKILKYNKGNPLFTSKDLESLWDKGFHSIAEANEKTAYYIASYALKGNNKEITNEETGEIEEHRDCMDASKNPAIGLMYFLKNAEQIINSDDLTPRYYVKKLEDYEKLSDKYPEYKETIKKFPELLYQHEEKISELIKERSDHEIFAKFTIKNQKNSLHSSNFREDYQSNKKDYRSIREKEFLGAHLKSKRDLFAKEKKHD
jgi:hypothetical protein